MTVGIDVEVIEACCCDLQTSTAPDNLELCRGLIGEHLPAEVDKICVALEDVPIRHGVRLARDTGVLDQHTFRVAAADPPDAEP